MQVNVTGRHSNLSPEIKNYALGKVEQLVKYYDGITNVEVVIDREHKDDLVEMVAHVGHSAPLVAKHRGEGIMVSMDAAFDKLERQIRKLKDRRRKRRMHHGPAQFPPPEPSDAEEGLFEGEEEFEKQL